MKKLPPNGVVHKAVLWNGEWKTPRSRGSRPMYCVRLEDDWLVRWTDGTESLFELDEVRDDVETMKALAAEAVRSAQDAEKGEKRKSEPPPPGAKKKGEKRKSEPPGAKKKGEKRKSEPPEAKKKGEKRKSESPPPPPEAKKKGEKRKSESPPSKKKGPPTPKEKRRRHSAPKQPLRAASAEVESDGMPRVYGAEDVLGMVSSRTSAKLAHFESCLKALLKAIKPTREGVIHGVGVVANRNLKQGEVFPDPTSLYVAGSPPESQLEGKLEETFVRIFDGFFKIHFFRDDPIRKVSYSFLINEARDQRPNVAYVRSHDGSRPVLGLKVLTPVLEGQELLCVYDGDLVEQHQIDDDDDDDDYNAPTVVEDDVIQDDENSNKKKEKPTPTKGILLSDPSGLFDGIPVYIPPESPVPLRVRPGQPKPRVRRTELLVASSPSTPGGAIRFAGMPLSSSSFS